MAALLGETALSSVTVWRNISIMAFFFFVTLVTLISRKVKNKRKVGTSISYVIDLYKLDLRALKSERKVQNNLDLK